LLVPPGDVGALAEALIELLRNPDQRAAYGAFGRMQVEGYDWNVVADRFIEQVEPFVGGTAAHPAGQGDSRELDKVDKVAYDYTRKSVKVTQGTQACP
jgi:hypothetical protein